ncbi:MAG: NUDIX domain-containing protein [Imperialibacter sp.]|uniref:NUDIX hydrolase n=1 Tax=Imperialibacter sp. TaxID=2038411 RepID=UPI0032EAEAEB
MDSLQEIRHFLEKGYQDYRSNVSVDCTIFGYHEGKLQVLLLKNKLLSQWSLPGGYVKHAENLDEAAARVTAERTGIQNLFLKQFKAFGDPDRNRLDGFDPEKLYEMTGVRVNEDSWLAGQAVTIGFYAITDIVHAQPKADIFSSESQWFSIDELPRLAFDHNEIVREALFNMRIHLYHFPIGKNLLPQKFTLKEIRLFYEVMSGKTLNASNFPNKLISIGLIKKTDEKLKIGAHRSPTFYTFNDEVYEKALEEGVVLV